MNLIAITVIVIYLTALLFVSIATAKKIRAKEDFLVAGRRLGPVLLAGALAATEIGGGSSLGVMEKAYGNWGLSAIWYVVSMAVVFILLAVVTPKIRGTRVKTIPEYITQRYGVAPGIISASCMMLFPLIGFTVVQFMVSGVLISVITGFSYKISVLLIASLVTSYAVFGGLWSVTLTDFIQIIIIVIGMLICVPVFIQHAGGWQHIVHTVEPPKLTLFAGIGWKTIVSLMVMYFASFAVSQEVMQKIYAAKSEKVARQASLLTALIFVLYAFIPAVIGVVAYSMVKSGSLSSSVIALNGAKYAFPVIAVHILPQFFVGVLFAGLIGATISSGTSDLLGGASIFANDLYKTYLCKNASDREVLFTARVALIILGILCMLIAMINTQGIIVVLMFSFSLRGAGLFIPYVFGHYWRKASWQGTLASMLFGSIIVYLVQYKYVPALFGMEPIVSGLAMSFLVFIIVTKFFPAVHDN